tara:strand:- start:31 stop:303 length:273 start_codon:yes stop_codon:yes gene_type:complete
VVLQSQTLEEYLEMMISDISLNNLLYLTENQNLVIERVVMEQSGELFNLVDQRFIALDVNVESALFGECSRASVWCEGYDRVHTATEVDC